MSGRPDVEKILTADPVMGRAVYDAGAQARSALAASTPALPAASAPAAATSVDACITAIQTLVQRVKATEGDTWTALQREAAEMLEEYRQRGLWHG